MLEVDDSSLEPFAVDGFNLPLLRLNDIGFPDTEIKVGDVLFKYERSFPYKGYGAVMPRYLQQQIDAGKRPLLVERINRFYVYFAS